MQRQCKETDLALDEVLLDEITGSGEEIDVAPIEAEANNRFLPGARAIDPRQDSDIEVAFDLLGQVDEILREGQRGHSGRVRETVLAAAIT